jgi:hypothetical protein
LPAVETSKVTQDEWSGNKKDSDLLSRVREYSQGKTGQSLKLTDGVIENICVTVDNRKPKGSGNEGLLLGRTPKN